MIAVPDTDVPAPSALLALAPARVIPTGRRPDSSRGRRAVAVVVDAMELLRPQSDLVRLLETFDRVDVLIATEYGPEAPSDDLDDDEEPGVDEVANGVEKLGIDKMALHRLGLRLPLATSAPNDLVAAMSELVGFDPEAGVYCLAPAVSATDPARTTVNQAALRIAQVYGLPLLRYRCLELSVVGADSS